MLTSSSGTRATTGQLSIVKIVLISLVNNVLFSLVNIVYTLLSLVNNVNALFSLVGSPQQFSNDIALVRLAEEADISVFTPACLPNINQAGSSRVNLTVTDKLNDNYDNICKSYSFSCQNSNCKMIYEFLSHPISYYC